jgi:hypothetical protein
VMSLVANCSSTKFQTWLWKSSRSTCRGKFIILRCILGCEQKKFSSWRFIRVQVLKAVSPCRPWSAGWRPWGSPAKLPWTNCMYPNTGKSRHPPVLNEQSHYGQQQIYIQIFRPHNPHLWSRLQTSLMRLVPKVHHLVITWCQNWFNKHQQSGMQIC